LVGATEKFIMIPFYIEGLMQGLCGGITGIALLYISFIFISSNLSGYVLTGFVSLRFFSFAISCLMILGSMLIGWIGCFLSFTQLKKI
ncbi:MAG: ABC transporter permease, partial [Deltaproteobacteria bacterium]|nr:ABC transporter permease [Deltaproteobacteria bacterium]